jgi:hypothetical protein
MFAVESLAYLDRCARFSPKDERLDPIRRQIEDSLQQGDSQSK